VGMSSLAIERCLHPPRLYRFTVARSATWWPQATLAGPAVVQVDDRDELAARGDRTDERCVEGLSADLKIGTPSVSLFGGASSEVRRCNCSVVD
jgi:hypothetical protein